jgi:hypothetical protein
MSPISPSTLTEAQKQGILAAAEKGQQLAGHFPDATAIDRLRRMLDGAITVEEAWAEVEAEWRALQS